MSLPLAQPQPLLGHRSARACTATPSQEGDPTPPSHPAGARSSCQSPPSPQSLGRAHGKGPQEGPARTGGPVTWSGSWLDVKGKRLSEGTRGWWVAGHRQQDTSVLGKRCWTWASPLMGTMVGAIVSATPTCEACPLGLSLPQTGPGRADHQHRRRTDFTAHGPPRLQPPNLSSDPVSEGVLHLQASLV